MNRKAVEELVDLVVESPVPRDAKGNDLCELLADLYEVDGYVVGLAYSSLGGSRVTVDPTAVSHLLERLETVSLLPDDEDAARSAKNYLEKLQMLVNLLTE
ncbi:MAG: hypothetical protein IPL36_11245 [Nigerium sp.]|nr:hypothetical protein [Nigerium sp.]